MTEDFNRLTELLTPTFLRKPRLLAWLRVMIASPLQERYAHFNLFKNRVDYEATVTPQVIALQDAVSNQFDCVCEIIELDGLPYDFLVSIDRSRDLEAIKGFINRHKLAGKSFVFELGDVIYTANWINYAFEDLIELYSAEWIGYVGEDDGVIGITVSVLKRTEDDTWYATARADKPVASNLLVSVSAYYYLDGTGNLALGGTATIHLLQGESTQEATLNIIEGVTMLASHSASLYPNEDETYKYVIK